MARAATMEQMEQKAEREMERAKEHAEVSMGAIEKLPSPIFMGLAGGSILLSLILFFRREKENAIFVGHWAPTFLILGMFLKLLGAKMKD